jgi:putative flippase GtrA
MRRLVGWFVLGVSASLVELALLRGLYELLGWPLPLATAIAAEVLILAKFLLNDRFVFGHAAPTLRRVLRYHGASAGALVVYWLVINALTLFAGVAYVAAFVIGTAAAFTWSLITNFLWVWAQPAPSQAGAADR